MGHPALEETLQQELLLEVTSPPQPEEHPALEETSQQELLLEETTPPQPEELQHWRRLASTTGRDSTTIGEYTNDWESTTAADHMTTSQSTTKSDPTTLPPSQCIDQGCSSEHDGWGECVDFSPGLRLDAVDHRV